MIYLVHFSFQVCPAFTTRYEENAGENADNGDDFEQVEGVHTPVNGNTARDDRLDIAVHAYHGGT